MRTKTMFRLGSLAGTVLCTTVILAAPSAFADHEIGFPGDGVFRVNVDIQPGLYASGAPRIACTWVRHATLGNSSMADAIDTGTSQGQQYARIARTDAAFETTGCTPWVLQKPDGSGPVVIPEGPAGGGEY